MDSSDRVGDFSARSPLSILRNTPGMAGASFGSPGGRGGRRSPTDGQGVTEKDGEQRTTEHPERDE